MLTFVERLNRTQIRQLERLLSQCKKKDGNTIPVYQQIITKSRELACNALYYQDRELVGFLAVFFFYENACEISLMVAPHCRGRGIGRELLASILFLLDNSAIDSLVFSAPHQVANPFLERCHAEYLHSEFAMERKNTKLETLPDNPLRIRTATERDIPFMCALDKVCFNGGDADMANQLELILRDKNRTVFIALLNDRPVAKAHVYWDQSVARFSDIAVLPKAQGKGYGRALIAYCINHALKQQKRVLHLDVEAQNQNALRLYASLGFKVVNAYDFWRVSLDILQKRS